MRTSILSGGRGWKVVEHDEGKSISWSGPDLIDLPDKDLVGATEFLLALGKPGILLLDVLKKQVH